MNDIHRIDKEIRKNSRNIKNRIQSILEDSRFVENVAKYWNLPVLSNERAGRWYVPADLRSDSVYFKSTDGHTTQWNFSLRRLNLHLLDIIESSGGAIIVDSTRRGKRYPDALSKTIPIWCSVINMALFGDNTRNVEKHSVSPSEKSQIESNLSIWKHNFVNCGVDIELLGQKISKPLYPIFIDPDSPIWSTNQFDPKYFPLILCSSSRKADDGTDFKEGYTYVQGAGDDHELWASSLNPDIFWENYQTLGDENLSNDELYRLIENYTEQAKISSTNDDIFHIKPTNISISKGIQPNFQGFTFDLTSSKSSKSKNTASFPLSAGKLGSKQLRSVLPQIVNVFKEQKLSSKPILICCDTGSDISVAVAVCFLCLFFDNEFKPSIIDRNALTKALIRKKLVHIIIQKPVNPSRTTLNSLNAYLLS